MKPVDWILESDVFPNTHQPLRDAVRNHDMRLIDWSDDWWTDGFPEFTATQPTIFHGSLGNAARINAELGWRPGSYCPTESFRCSSWYESVAACLIHKTWKVLSAIDLVEHAKQVASELSSCDQLFVRPDSPLKPFSGRVVAVETMSLADLDHGFYFDDENIAVIAAPTQTIHEEVRFVVVDRRIIAGSGYDASTREPANVPLSSEAAKFAQEVADSVEGPAPVFVIDVCRCETGWRLLEFNPFGGADLYACDPNAVVQAVSDTARNQWLK